MLARRGADYCLRRDATFDPAVKDIPWAARSQFPPYSYAPSNLDARNTGVRKHRNSGSQRQQSRPRPDKRHERAQNPPRCGRAPQYGAFSGFSGLHEDSNSGLKGLSSAGSDYPASMTGSVAKPAYASPIELEGHTNAAKKTSLRQQRGNPKTRDRQDTEEDRIDAMVAQDDSFIDEEAIGYMTDDPTPGSAAETYFKPISPHAPPGLKALLRKGSWGNSQTQQREGQSHDLMSISNFEPEVQSSTDLANTIPPPEVGERTEARKKVQASRIAPSELSAIAQIPLPPDGE